MRFGDYEVLKPIAHGGMGAVFEVENARTRARYAAKVVKDAGKPQALERFRREAELLARVDRHPGIVRVHSFGETEDGGLYMILDLVRGESLDRKLEREGKLEPRAAAALARTVAAALGAAHAQGVVHRDVKPANILVDAASGEPRLADFGIATALDLERLTRTGGFVGTAAYLAPERTAGDPGTPTSDVFSLGCVLFQMLAGVRPVPGSSPAQVLAQLVTIEPIADVRTLRPEVPAALAGIVARALEKDPARRLASGASLAAELDAFLAGDSARLPRRATPRRPLLPGGPVPWAGAVLLGAGVVLLSLLVANRRRREEPLRSPVETLESISRASAGTCEVESLLAARAALALAAETSEAVSWETRAAGARAALALGAPALALELTGRAPAEETLRLLHARALLGAGDLEAGLAELATLGSAEAARLEAHHLLLEGRWPELGGLDPRESSFAAGARALARGRLDGDMRRARQEIGRAGGDPDLLAALDLLEARAELAPIDSATAGEDLAVLDYLSQRPERLEGPCRRAIVLLERAHLARRYVAASEALSVVDRALHYHECILHSVGALTPDQVALVDALARTAFLFGGRDDPATVLVQARLEELVGSLDDHLDKKRRAFLERTFDATTGPVSPQLGLTISQIYELRCIGRAVGPEVSLERMERLLGRLPPAETAVVAVEARAEAERVASELALRCMTDAPEAERERLLGRAVAHHSEAARALLGSAGHPVIERRVGRTGVMVDLERGDLEAARKELTNGKTLDDRFLAGEVERRRGNAALAEPLLREAATTALEHQGDFTGLHYVGDALVSLHLAELALGDPNARDELARVYDQRASYFTLLPWIDRDARKALGR
jgi:serine/threonine protein kinase